MWRQGFLSGSGGAERVTESVVFSGLFVFVCVFAQEEAKAIEEPKSLCPKLQGCGHQPSPTHPDELASFRGY